MAENFTKLFGSITASTVWMEDSDTRIVWVTMLAMADHDGYVGASIPGLASIARVPIEKVVAALEKFKAPDPYSRSKEHDGRRIEEFDRGWVLLNYGRFRELRAEAERRERDRVRQQRKRERDKAAAEKASEGATESGNSHVVTRDAVTNPKSHEISSDSDSVSSGSGSLSVSGPDPSRAIPCATWDGPTKNINPGLWDAATWLRMHDKAWCEVYGGHSSGGGMETAKACAELGDRLAGTTTEERLAAQERSPAMFREWLADATPAVLDARHPFAWFVRRFDGLRRDRRIPRTATGPPRRGRGTAAEQDETARRMFEEGRKWAEGNGNAGE